MVKSALAIAVVFASPLICMARGGVEATDLYGQPCIRANSQGIETSMGSGQMVLRHNYVFENRCKRGFELTIETRAGWKSYLDVRANSSSAWFCTDGLKENKDCNGGVRSFTTR